MGEIVSESIDNSWVIVKCGAQMYLAEDLYVRGHLDGKKIRYGVFPSGSSEFKVVPSGFIEINFVENRCALLVPKFIFGKAPGSLERSVDEKFEEGKKVKSILLDLLNFYDQEFSKKLREYVLSKPKKPKKRWVPKTS